MEGITAQLTAMHTGKFNVKQADQSRNEKILAAAKELFSQNSFEKTSMEEIARHLSMSKATLYAEFGNKEEVLLAMCLNHCLEMDRAMLSKLEGTTSNYVQCLADMLRMFAIAVYRECQSIRTPETLAYMDEKIKNRLESKFEETKDIFKTVLNKAMEAGELPKTADTSLLCEVVIAMMTSYLPPYDRHFRPAAKERPNEKVFTEELNTLLKFVTQGLKHYKTT